jgi:hypothetical protein
MSKTVFRFGFILFSVILILIIAELLLRKFKPQVTYDNVSLGYDFHCFAKGDFYPLALKKNTDCILKSNIKSFEDVVIKTNSLGLRGKDIPFEKTPDTKRLLFIGDSFTMGWAVEEQDAYPFKVGEFLKVKQKNIQIINAGLGSTGPDYYYLYYKNQGYKFQPDTVVVGFYLMNDIPEDKHFTRWIETDDSGLPTKVEMTQSFFDSNGNFTPINMPVKFRFPYLRHLHVFSLVMDQFFTPQYSQEHRLTLTTCLYKKDCHDLDKTKEEAMKLFAGLKKLTSQNKSRFLVVFIPASYQLDVRERVKYGISANLTPDDLNYPYEQFKKFFDSQQIEYLDLRPIMKKNMDKKLYIDNDEHFTPQAHEIAAKEIADKILEIGIKN